MARIYSINRTCDRCGATMKSVQLEIGQVPEERDGEEEMDLFSIGFKNEAHRYKDLCPRCEKTLTRIFNDAGPIQRSHSAPDSEEGEPEGANGDDTKDTKGEGDTKDTKGEGEPSGGNGTSTNGRKRMPGPKPPSRPEVPK